MINRRSFIAQTAAGGAALTIPTLRVAAQVDTSLYDGLELENASTLMAPGATPVATPIASPAASPAAGASVTGFLLGDPNAPVTLTILADYQCPHCRAFHSADEPKLIEEFVKTGKVRLELLDMPVVGLDDVSQFTDDNRESVQAAEAAMCAAEQDAFIAYRESLYAGELQPNSGGFSNENLKTKASELGLDPAVFGAALDSKKYESAIIQSFQTAVSLGAQGTPSFSIDRGPAFFLDDTGYESLKTQLDAAVEAAS